MLSSSSVHPPRNCPMLVLLKLSLGQCSSFMDPIIFDFISEKDELKLDVILLFGCAGAKWSPDYNFSFNSLTSCSKHISFLDS